MLENEHYLFNFHVQYGSWWSQPHNSNKNYWNIAIIAASEESHWTFQVVKHIENWTITYKRFYKRTLWNKRMKTLSLLTLISVSSKAQFIFVSYSMLITIGSLLASNRPTSGYHIYIYIYMFFLNKCLFNCVECLTHFRSRNKKFVLDSCIVSKIFFSLLYVTSVKNSLLYILWSS